MGYITLLSMVIKMSKQKRGLLFVILVFFFLFSCMGRSLLRTDAVVIQKEGQIPFILVFPVGVEVKDSAIPLLKKKKEKTVLDLWSLVRYYHVIGGTEEDLMNAREIYREISLKDESYRIMVWTNEACLLVQMGKYRDSEEIFHQLIQEGVRHISAYYNTYLLYKHSGKEKDGIKVLSLMMERFPDDTFSYIELGNILTEKGKYTFAQKLYQDAHRIDKRNYMPLYRMALLKEQQKEYAEAELYYDKCMLLLPRNYDVYLNFSKMLIKVKKIEKANKVINLGLQIVNEE
jgi:tetratricopeptide (TPR) repeat protein